MGRDHVTGFILIDQSVVAVQIKSRIRCVEGHIFGFVCFEGNSKQFEVCVCVCVCVFACACARACACA